MKEVKRVKTMNTPIIIDRGAYDEQRCYDIAVKIISSKEKSYDEILESLKPFNVNNSTILKNVLERLRKYNFTFGRAATVVIKHKYNLKKGIVDNDLSKEFAKIGNIKREYKEEEKRKPSCMNVYSMNKNNVTIEEKVKLSTEFAQMLMEGIDDSEIAEKYNMSVSTVDNYLFNYLPKNPKMYAKYKVFKHKVDPISLTEVNQYMEVLIYFIKNLLETEKKLIESKMYSENRREINKEILKISKQREIYQKALNVLECEVRVSSSELKIEEDYIKDFCVNYSNALKTYKLLKSNNVSDDKQKEINKEYERLVYVK